MSFIIYDAPQFKWVSIVDMKAAKNETIKIEEGYQKLTEILHIDTPPDNEPSQINSTSTDEEIVEDYNENVS